MMLARGVPLMAHLFIDQLNQLTAVGFNAESWGQ
jgi:hypothetical protein